MNLRALTIPLLMTVILAGCGGGTSGTGTPSDPSLVATPPDNDNAATTGAGPAVTGIVPDRLMYGQVSRFSVAGHGLDAGIQFTAAGCGAIGAVDGGSDTQRAYTCTPTVTGAMPIAILSASGAPLASSTPVIPAPQVTLAISSRNASLGSIVMELYPDKAPATVANFLQYVGDGFYNNLIFHRVVPGFVIQGGGYDSSLRLAATRAPIRLETQNGLSNVRSAVAMARTTDPNSATSQFFINTVDNVGLDTAANGGYAVFGKVVAGMADVVDAIAAAPTQTVGAMQDVPVTPVVISSAARTR